MSARDEALRLLHDLPESASWTDVVRVVADRARQETGEVLYTRELQAEYGTQPAPPSAGSAPEDATRNAERSTEMAYHGRITIEPGKRSGKPCVRGLRITVGDVLGYLASGMPEDEILVDFPELEPEDIRACLAFAADRERRAAHVPS